ncbi:head-tail connector protein [Stakelama tenebrarum]|uniref:Phage gp6-like head-tail connector protein n=1 Tax=Stakelama tenebrarum TaxID=2711215 RepID=A0A6G6Y9H3_9SPHN|nr:phage head-tail connector protein [Sphingosinithalassobacter tenebrarum]QIG81569.1 hypothetical protein G5C33_18440 [Sphingosinithalassobacter tenebrarum]
MTPGFSGAVLAAARDAAKAYLRIADTSEDALIESLAESALALAEAFVGRALILRGFEDVMPVSRAWQRLDMAPVMAITAVTGIPAEGPEAELPVDAYAIDIDADGNGWIRVLAPGTAGRVRVTFQCGTAIDWDSLPAPIRQAVLLLIEHLFGGAEGAAPPVAAAALLRPWRRLRLRGAEHAA